MSQSTPPGLTKPDSHPRSYFNMNIELATQKQVHGSHQHEWNPARERNATDGSRPLANG